VDQYSQYIATSRYCRWLPDEGRRETWEEAVGRYIDFMEMQAGIESRDLDNALAACKQAILNLDVMPSMRALMTAGPALERDNIAGFNPVTGDTQVVTREIGNTPIKDLTEGTYTVLNKDGRWAEAVFRSYGKQPIMKVTARLNSNTVKEVECTQNHRWIKQDGTVVSTEQLLDGDRISFVSAPKPTVDDDYILGIRHGLVYGDGTTAKACGRVKGYIIRLCGEDNRELLRFFDGYPVTYPPSANGDPVVHLYDGFAATHALKELPSPSESESYLLGFVRGWLAADGSVTKASQISLCVAGKGKQWLEQNAERLGFVIQRTYLQSSETNYGKRRQDSWIVYFSRNSMVEDDFLCSWKRENFRRLNSHFVVKSVEFTGETKEVFCAEVEDTNTFVLAGGMVTGNCGYTVIDRPKAFANLMYILMCGTGVGFSVERQYINQLPEVASEFRTGDEPIVVGDSKGGWATAFNQLVQNLYDGIIPEWNLDRVRAAGMPLKTFGGRASGPEPLEELFRYTAALFTQARGRKLNSIECHDLACKIAEIVVVGGVRRSALISLSNLSDDRMRRAKSGQWFDTHVERALANNSVAYTEKPDIEAFMQEWLAIVQSKSGERGIFNRVAATKRAVATGRRDGDYDFGCNPCSM